MDLLLIETGIILKLFTYGFKLFTNKPGMVKLML